MPIEKINRRKLLRDGLWGSCLTALAAIAGIFISKKSTDEKVWQLDPHKCVACGNCATNCVLENSAVKCVHAYAMCGYCDLCTGFFEPEPRALDTGAENQLCPVDAIKRSFVEDPYYEYTIDESLCIGCGKCVKGCNAFGNGSLFLQVRHDRCLNCNECSIAAACPSQAYTRVSADEPYLIKRVGHA
jgi:electron transport complex protein RnfB